MANFTKIKKAGIVSTASLFLCTGLMAQKSVYDVVPGSGPKKTKEQKSVIDVTKEKRESADNKVYYPVRNRKNLPPGQAKKIYGGSAKDYAPGQVKKRKGWYWDGDKKKWHRKHKHTKRHHKG
jgi:hypothetical protein